MHSKGQKMNKKENIFEEIKPLLTKVSSIVFTNPFSLDRAKIDKEITGVFDVSDYTLLLPHLIKVVSSNLIKLDQAGYKTWHDFKKTDQPLMRNVYLFEAYHSYIYDLDNLIQEQMNTHEGNTKVKFASELMKLLKNRGFQDDELVHYISVFYQLRRAFYFIHKRLVGCSASMQKLRMDLWNNIFTHDIFFYEKFLISNMEDFSTLILGATGSGKGAAASSLGYCGYIPLDEKKQIFPTNFIHQFISVNLSQFSSGLIESELFGHKKGAFTGAISDHEGIFSRCLPEGAIFLDEIGEVNEATQIKLLKVLQERTFNKVGDYQNLRFSGKVIAATNQSIEELIESGKFREDFYYRLCSDVIRIPSLHQRITEDKNELVVMLENVIERITKTKNDELLDSSVSIIKKELGLDYTWPGNVRELEQCVRNIIIHKKCHQPLTYKLTQENWPNKMLKGELSSQELLSHYCCMLYEKEKSYEKVAKITSLDRRTVKKYVDEKTT
jgi:sigma-54 specific flagellar transcriptional regulator A